MSRPEDFEVYRRATAVWQKALKEAMRVRRKYLTVIEGEAARVVFPPAIDFAELQEADRKEKEARKAYVSARRRVLARDD